MSRPGKLEKINFTETINSDTIFNILLVIPSDPKLAIKLADMYNPPQGLSEEKLKILAKKTGIELTFMIRVASNFKEALGLVARKNIFPIDSNLSYRIHAILFEVSLNPENEKNLWNWEKFLHILVSRWGLARSRLLYGFIALVPRSQTQDSVLLQKLMRYGVRSIISSPINPDELEVKLREFCKDINGKSKLFFLENQEVEIDDEYIQVTEILRYKISDESTTGLTLPKYKKKAIRKNTILYQDSS